MVRAIGEATIWFAKFILWLAAFLIIGMVAVGTL